MIEIIFYGRGGQGAVMASQILATAAFLEGKYAQAFPRFGGERKGAPVMAYVRISPDPIEVRNPIEEPDMVIVLDSALLKTVEPLNSLRANGLAIVNTNNSPEEIKKLSKNKDIHTLADVPSASFQPRRTTPLPSQSLPGRHEYRLSVRKVHPPI